MGAYGVSVEKQLTFRGQNELTASVYHYRLVAPTEENFEDLADAVLARDKLAHPGVFTYKTLRIFGPTEGSAADNQMRLTLDLTGAGTRSPLGPNLYPELTVVPSIYVGRSPVKNRKVFVRKFIRVIIAQTSNGIDPVTGLLTGAERTFWNNWFNGCRQLTLGTLSNADMCTPSNIVVGTDVDATTLNYARIRQMHQ